MENTTTYHANRQAQSNKNLTPEEIDKKKLKDINPKNGKEKPWAYRKEQTMSIADSYKRIVTKNPVGSYSTWQRINDCGSWLKFKKHVQTGDRKLAGANFCKYKFCPMCSWRRSLKIFGQVCQVEKAATEKYGYEYIHVVLTQKNIPGSELKAEIDKISKALTRMYHHKWFKKAVEGFFRAIEVTHNVNKKSKDYDTYHPHIHMIWAVKKRYFKGEDYINQPTLCKKWQKLMHLDYAPRCWTEKIKESKNSKKHVAEVSKYITKSNEIISDDKDFTDKALLTLEQALFRKRMIAWGGIFKTIHAELNLDDAEDGSLINIDGDEELKDDLNYITEVFTWHIGYRQYMPKK